MNTNRELSILKWIGVVLACLSTLFTLAIVSSHLSGRLAGLGRVGIVGTVGAELMAISCAWFVASERKRVAFVAMICQVILTAVLLVNASIALDLDWQETLARKVAEQQLTAGKQAAEEGRKTMEKQAELALQLLEKDKRLARAFVRTGKSSEMESAEVLSAAGPTAPLFDVHRLSAYERYGLTVVPLFLALLTVIALAAAAQSGGAVQKSVADLADLPDLPDLAASVGMGSTVAALDAGTRSGKAEREIVETPSALLLPADDDEMRPIAALLLPADEDEERPAPLLPADNDEKRSVTVGRYQFRKDGAGWQCREIVGRGAGRRRQYLAYLSRAAYERMQLKSPTREELEEKLVEWADRKREEKRNASPLFQPAAEIGQRR